MSDNQNGRSNSQNNKSNSQNANNLNNNHNSDKLRLQIIVGFAVLVPIMLIVIVAVFNIRMSKAMKQQTAGMAENLNVQLYRNISNYMDTIEGNAAMIEADGFLASYVHSGDGASEEAAGAEVKLMSYALHSDYVDFGIVYADDYYIGRISDALLAAGGDKLYKTIEKSLSKTGGWTTELIPGRANTIYLYQINESAIGVVSTMSSNMTDEIRDVLFMDGMNVYVADKSLVVISTTDDSVTLGSYLRTDISRLVDRVGQRTQIGDGFVVASQQLDNDWYVITAVPSSSILTALRSTIKFVIAISVVLALLAIGYVIYMTYRIVDAVDQTVDTLDVKAQTDLLTGLINKRSFEEIVEHTLSNPEEEVSYAMIFMDIDNFKGVNDRCGHDVGDLVLKSFSHTIDTVFRETDIKGRLGGDEFCVLMKMTKEDDELLVGHINDVCRRFVDALHRKANSARQSLPAVTSSMGAVLWAGAPEGFEGMYHKADTALYASKKRGKDTWTIYGQGDTEDSQDMQMPV